MSEEKTYCGFIALIGRPNVGKSTLLNALLGQKISITAPKAQTTRQQIRGIKTIENRQMVFVDTPGIHLDEQRMLNRYMNKTALAALDGVDVVVFLVDGLHWTKEDEWVLQQLSSCTAPVILAINKIDKMPDKEKLLPTLEEYAKKRKFAAIVPISALKHKGVTKLEEEIQRFLPEGVHYFEADQITDRNERFLAAEMVREKLTRLLSAEVPYALTVEIEQFVEEGNLLRISALIWVERPGQKTIVIGEKGERLKKVGKLARIDMERFFGCKVFLQLWVKVKSGWADDRRFLHNQGYNLE